MAAAEPRSRISPWLLTAFLGLFLVLDVGGMNAATVVFNVVFLGLAVWFYRDLLWDTSFDPLITRCYFVFCGISFVSLFVNAWSGLDVPHALALLFDFCFGYVIYVMALSAARDNIKGVMTGLVLFGVVRSAMAIWGFERALASGDTFIGMKVYAVVGGVTANKLAATVLPIIPLCAVKMFQGRRRLMWGAALIVLLVGIIASLSRGAMIALVLGLVAAFPFYVRRVKWWKVVAVLSSAVALGWWLIPSALIDANLSRFQYLSVQYFVDEGPKIRLQLWHAAWSRFVASPVLGCGPGCVADAIARESIYVRYAHSYLFDSLANTGLLGTVCFLLMLGIVLYRSARIANASALGVGLFTATVATLFHGLVEITFPDQEYLAVFWILAAVITVVYEQRRVDVPALGPAIYHNRTSPRTLGNSHAFARHTISDIKPST